MRVAIGLMLSVVVRGVASMGSGSSKACVCPEHGVVRCPVCGSALVKIEYKGDEAELLAVTKLADFRGFVGCVRVDLHNKVVDGVDYSGKVYVRPVFDDRR